VVSAVNASGESGVSAQVSAHPVSSAPIQVDYALNANQLEIAWPPDHTGWQVQVQTNSSSTGLGTNWVTLPETMGTNRYSVPIDSGSGSAFYRLFHP
jgi:hypothetical protein